MARRVRRLPTPWTVSTPHRPSGISFLSNFYDRQVLFTGIPAVPTAGNRRRVNLRKKTRERTRPCGASSGFSCLCSSRVSCFRRAALGARRYFFEPGMGAINFLSPESLPQVPHTSGFTPGELLHRNGLCICKLFIPARLPAAVRSREKWMQENGSWKGPNPVAGMRFSALRDFIAQNPPSCFLVLLVETAKDILRRSQPLHAPPSNAPP